MKKLLLAGLAGAAVGIAGIQMVSGLPPAIAASNISYEQLDLFGEVFSRVRNQYVEEVDDSDLVESALSGMLSSLDPHSSFLNKKNYGDMRVQTRGEFGGLGIEVTMENGLVKVISPIDDTPASKAGIKAGDYITHLDGEPILGLTLGEAVDLMRGPVDSDIALTVAREGLDETLAITITRAVIQIRAVRSRVEKDIGYVRITSFNEHTYANLETAMAKLKTELGDDLNGYVVDLRNNPGGLLDQAIAVSDAFLEQGEIVSTRGRNPQNAQRHNARSGDLAEGKPIIVLINGGSASASEIVAGALQDHRRAIILGTKSFGKGSVQTIIPLGSGGNRGALRLTTSRYYTPSGRSIQAKGITPDIEVEPAKLEKIDGRKRVSEADLRGSLKNDTESEDENAETSENDTPDDYQLSYALDLLRGLTLMEQARATQ